MWPQKRGTESRTCMTYSIKPRSISAFGSGNRRTLLLFLASVISIYQIPVESCPMSDMRVRTLFPQSTPKEQSQQRAPEVIRITVACEVLCWLEDQFDLCICKWEIRLLLNRRDFAQLFGPLL